MPSKTLSQIQDDEYFRFYNALAFTIPREGGYVNDPDDPGGETKWGVSKRYHPNEDIQNLTPQRAAEIYYEEYWLGSGADLLPDPLCTVVFDSAVLCGPGRAKQWLTESKGDIYTYLAARRRHHVRNSKPKYLRGHLNRVKQLEQHVECK